MSEKIMTISVAAYNVEKYLDKLMSSLLDKRILDDIEILVVNDGSKDKTAEITKRYENEYPETVRLVDKENGGHGSTINRGIIEATGKYFRALDGDDWVDTESFVKLVEYTKKYDVDMILTDYIRCYEDGSTELVKEWDLDNGKIYDADKVWKQFKRILYHQVVFKTEILKENNITLDENCFYVDSEFVLYPIPYINNVVYFDLVVYCYRLGRAGQSVSVEGTKKNVSHYLKVAKSLFEFYKRNEKELSDIKKKYLARRISYNCTWYFDALMLFGPSSKNKKDIIDFENYVKETLIDSYNSMAEISKCINLLRKSGYSLYLPLNVYRKLRK